MNVDSVTSLLATGAAALLVTGGMVLRSAFVARSSSSEHEDARSGSGVPGVGPSAQELALANAVPKAPDLPGNLGAGDSDDTSSLPTLRPDGFVEADERPRAPDSRLEEAIRKLAGENRKLEAERADLREKLERGQAEIEKSRAENTRLAGELDNKQSIIQQMGTWLDEARLKQKAAELDLATVRATAEKERAAAATQRPRPEVTRAPDPALAPLRAEVADLRKKLEQATRERESAEAKGKALETLVEAVRARSRDLAAQVESLKAKENG